MKIDLHVHSTASDGKFSPKELIDQAISIKMKAIAITDHDSIDGLKEAIDYSKGRKIEFVPGVEFSANPRGLAKEIHIVGLFIDYSHEAITKLLVRQEESRVNTCKKMIEKLNELGYKITYEEAKNEAKREKFGKPIIASILLKKYNFKDRKQVFDELLGTNGKAFFMYESSSMKEIINAIHISGGIAILAHPAYLLQNADIVIDKFVNLRGDGLEVDCAYNSFEEEAPSLRKKFKKIAKEKSLIVSGGTDFHNLEISPNIGSFGVTEKEFQKIKVFLKK
ncbi:hypothetical protein A3K73_03920 [Candidatus Pacearchaeota archaeon RBG_13_36_9]|nr:MAG: hypothetical protein A3K73_03920 [Candidatus Pacearchaeota archaeon RBG_13_36_9]